LLENAKKIKVVMIKNGRICGKKVISPEGGNED
jgi:hypothetical protein